LPAVAFVSPKGGAGKTTAALLLALGLSARGHRVAIIDSDPNKPLVRWASLPDCPRTISVHPAPTAQDMRDALREAQRKQPDWIILDTEGSIRGAMVFTTIRLDMVVTPLAASQLEAVEAIKAAELVGQYGRRQGRELLHRALLTRVPAAVRPRSVKQVVQQLRDKGVDLLPTALMEKEAFRMLFDVGGDLEGLERHGAHGLASARTVATAYVDSVLEALENGRSHAADHASHGTDEVRR
jgi:chromosome partitioning protein